MVEQNLALLIQTTNSHTKTREKKLQIQLKIILSESFEYNIFLNISLASPYSLVLEWTFSSPDHFLETHTLKNKWCRAKLATFKTRNLF
jgi:hypothetical protein